MRFPLDLIWLGKDGQRRPRRPRGPAAPPEVLREGALGGRGQRRHRRRLRRRRPAPRCRLDGVSPRVTFVSVRAAPPPTRRRTAGRARAGRGPRTRPRPRPPPRAAARTRSAAPAARSSSRATSSSSGAHEVGAAPSAPTAPGVAAQVRRAATSISARRCAAAFTRDRLERAGSTSTASTGAQPSRAAAIASTPLPAAPVGQRAARARARAAARGTAAWWGARRSPNAWPGSITRSMPAVRQRRSHGGRTRSRRKRHGDVDRPVPRLPALGPVVGDRRGRDVDQRVARRAPAARRRSGSSPARAVERVLDRVRPSVALLQPAPASSSSSSRQHDLGAAARRGTREPDERAITRRARA